MTLRVGVLMGGSSTERHTSIKTGEAVYHALYQRGYEAVKIDVDQDAAEKIKSAKIDVAYIAMQGKNCGDGTTQALMEILKIPYTGCNVLTSAIINDKIATKKMLLFEGIKTPRFITIHKQDYINFGEQAAVERIKSELGLPAVIKAPTQGSSIGIAFAYAPEDILPGMHLSFQYDDALLIEEMIFGTELTAAVIGNYDPVALPIVEIQCVKGVYDAETKTNPSLRTHIVPARIEKGQAERVRETALHVYKALNCRGFARIDFILDRTTGEPVVIEVNAVPGMAPNSLFPKAAKAAGIELEDLVDRLIQLALTEKKENSEAGLVSVK